MSYLLDTNVISELRRANPNGRVAKWAEGVSANEFYLSVMVVGEIRQGIERLKRTDAPRAASLETWLAGLEADYGDRILPVTSEIAQRWGALNIVRTYPVVDGLLAATALVENLTFVTRNRADMAGSGVKVLDPFSE